MLVNESSASEVVSFRPSCESGNYSLETISYKFKLMVRMLIPMSSLGPKGRLPPKKTGKCGIFSQVGGPPPLSLGTPCL